jgi:hypothetical protein
MCQNVKDATHTLRLYDARNYTTGPFQDIVPSSSLQMRALTPDYPQLIEEAISRPVKSNWTDFEFSRDGSHIVINTDSEVVWLIDSFRNDVQPKVFGPRKNDSNNKLDPYEQRKRGAMLLTKYEKLMHDFEVDYKERLDNFIDAVYNHFEVDKEIISDEIKEFGSSIKDYYIYAKQKYIVRRTYLKKRGRPKK